jgi:hypothetical protein
MTKNGPTVAIVAMDQHIHFQKIDLGRDHGAMVEVASGLSGAEALVINPAENLAEGTVVVTLNAKNEVAGK